MVDRVTVTDGIYTELDTKHVPKNLINVQQIGFETKEPNVELEKLKKQSLNKGNALLEDDIDVKEMQNKIITKTELDDTIAGNYQLETITEHETANLVSLLSLDLDGTRRLLNPESKERRAYIILDSKYREFQSQDRTSIRWSFLNNADIVDGSTNALGFIRDIKSIRIMEFYMNILDPTWQNDQMIQTILIEELRSQAFIAPESRRFHFVAKMWSDNYVVVPPTYLYSFMHGADVVSTLEYLYRLQSNNDGVFSFKTPIQTLNTITLSFGAPYTLMPLPIDTYSFAYNSGGINSFVITTTPDHNMPVGATDRVYISNFNTDDPTSDATLISLLNNPPDGIVYVGQSISPSQLVVSPPNNVITNIFFPALVGTQLDGASIYLTYYEFFIGMEVTYLSDTNDL